MKSFFSKLGVLLLGATFAVVGCTDFAEDIREVGEKVDKVDNKVDNNVADITVNTDAIEAKIKEMEAQHAADKKAAEEALAALKTTLDGKIKADIEAAEAKLTAAYEKADAAIKATAVADKAELKADVQKAADEALKAVAAAKAELEAAYKAADEEIKKAYAEADAKLKSDLEAEIATLKVELEKADAEQKKAIEEQIKALKDNLSKSEADLTKMVKDLEAKLLQADADNKNALKLEIADLQSRLKDADAANKAELEKKINDLRTELSQIDAKNKQDIENKISEIATELRKADTDNKAELTAIINDLKVTLMGADAANKAELEKKISGFELSLLTARTELEKSITALENNFEKQIETINSSIKNLTESIANVEKEYKKADDVLRDEFAGADAALKSELNTKIDNLETALKNDDAALKAALELSLQSLGDELRKADVDNKAELTKQISDLAAALRNEDAAMEVALKKYADDIKAVLEQADADNKAELLGLIAELESNLKDNKAELEKTIEELANELRKADSDLSDKVDNLENTLRGETETVKKALEQKIADLATELRKADSDLSDKVDNLENTLRGETEEVKKALEKKIADLKVELLAADVALETKLQANIDKAVADAASALATAKADLTAAYQAADAALDAAIKENAKNIEENAKAIEELKDADDKLNAAILELADARMIGDAVLEQKIKDEAIARAEAMQALQNANYASIQSLISMINVNAAAIEAEKDAREAAETVLQQNIDKVAADLAKARTDFEQADKDLKALIDKNAGNIATNLDEIVKLQGRATALEGRVAALESWQTTAKAEIAANASAISDLDTELDNLEKAYKAADVLLQQNIDKVAVDLADYKKEVEKAFTDAANKTTQDIAAAESRLNNAISELSGKLTKEVNTLNSTITGVETALKALIEANTTLIEAETNARIEADKKINQTITDLEAAYKAADVTINATLADLAKADTDNKAALEQKITDTATDLNNKIAAAKTDLTAAINAAKAELNKAINDEATARQNAIDAINTLINGINSDIATINGVNDAQNTRLTDLETKAAQAIADIVSLGNRLTAVEGRLDKAEEDIKELDKLVDSLFNQIQSVVYKPTHADGKARIDYGKLGSAILEGNSVITYKVYPKTHVEIIKDAFKKGLLTLTYDLESVTKAGEPALEVLSVDNGAKGGELAVTVKASNLGAATFYSDTPSISWSAALVLSYGAENFSTEYTNLVAGEKTDYSFDLYVNDALYSAAENQTIKYAATNPELWTMTVLDGLNVKFSDATNKYTPADFFEIYPLAEDMFEKETPVITNPSDLFVPGEDANGYVTAYLDESKVASTNVGEVFNVKYGYTFDGVTKNAEGNIEIVAFPWAIQIDKNDGGVTDPLQLPYTDDMVVKVLPDYEITFTDGGTGVMTEKQLVDAGYCVKVDTLEVVTAVTTAMGGATADLFTVAKIDDKEVAPVQVSLAKDGGVNKAVAANVGTIFNVKYSFDYKVGTETITAAESIDADVKIEKTMYSFDVTVPEIQWTYDPDATADAAIAGGYCSRVLEYANDEAGIISAAYRTGSTDKALMNGALTIEEVLAAGSVTEIKVGADTYTGVAIADSPIQFSAGTPADDKVEVQLEKLAWGAYDGQTGKEYVASATYELSSAIVNINLTASTRDRNRDAIEIDLGEKSVVYAANLIVEPTTEIPLGLNDALVANKHLGSATSVDDALLTDVLNAAVATNYVTYVDDAHKRENATAMKTGLQFADALGVACFDKVTYGYHYGNLTNTSLGYTNGSIVPKLYAYSASFTTWYGQVVNVALDFKLEDPNYNFAPVYQYIQGTAADGYYVQVNPEYTYDILDPNKLNDFSVKQVNLNASFDVMNGDVKMDAAAMASASLVKKFEMINNDDANITFADAPVNTIINYSGSKDFVNVNGSLTIENNYSGTKTYYPIAETIFTGDFATFQVHKYDPIAASITVLDNKAEQGVVITDAKIYEFYVLDNFSLKDKLGNELIDPSETDGANAWVVGVPENKISNGVSVASIYDLTATYELKVTSPTTGVVPTGITVDSANGKITIDNSSQIVFANPVVIQAKVTITYPQGKRESSYVTYTFGDK